MARLRSPRNSLPGTLLLVALASAVGSASAQRGRVPGLHDHAERGDVESVRRRIDSGRNPDVPSRQRHQRTPLHSAAERGHAPVVALLLEAEVDTNARTDQGFTPLHLAACFGHTEVIALLLASGAIPDARDTKGRSPLHLAALSGEPRALLHLLPAKAPSLGADEHGWTPLHHAAAAGRVECVRVLAEFTDCLDQRSASGSTALHFAARRGDREMMKALLTEGADPEARDFLGRTPKEVCDESLALREHRAVETEEVELPPIPKELLLPAEGLPAIFTTWTTYCVGVAPPPEGCDLAIWNDGVVMFSAERRPNHDLRVGRISPERLAFLWRELEETGVLDYDDREVSGPGSTVRRIHLVRGDRRASVGVADYWLIPHHLHDAEDRTFVHTYVLAAEIIGLALPEQSWAFQELGADGVYRTYDPKTPHAWKLAWR